MDSSKPNEDRRRPDALTEFLLAMRSQGSDLESVHERLYEILYEDLRSAARLLMKSERSGHTLQPTALVHEAFLRFSRGGELTIRDRAHFLAIATRAMRQVLVDHSRKGGAQKASRPAARGNLSESETAGANAGLEDPFLTLESGLEKLESLHPRVARVCEMKIIGGMDHDQIAEALDVSRRTVAGDWSFGKRWLSRELQEPNR